MQVWGFLHGVLTHTQTFYGARFRLHRAKTVVAGCRFMVSGSASRFWKLFNNRTPWVFSGHGEPPHPARQVRAIRLNKIFRLGVKSEVMGQQNQIRFGSRSERGNVRRWFLCSEGDLATPRADGNTGVRTPWFFRLRRGSAGLSVHNVHPHFPVSTMQITQRFPLLPHSSQK